MICTGPSNVRMSATYISMFTSTLVLLSATTYQLYSYHDKQDGPHVPPPPTPTNGLRLAPQPTPV